MLCSFDKIFVEIWLVDGFGTGKCPQRNRLDYTDICFTASADKPGLHQQQKSPRPRKLQTKLDHCLLMHSIQW